MSVDERTSSADATVLALCAEVWQWRLSECPEMATIGGFHQHDDRLEDISGQAYIRREKCVREFLKKAESLDVSSCSQDVLLNHVLLMDGLRTYLNGAKFKSYLMPVNFLEGTHVDPNIIIQYMKFDSEEDFEKFISRLEKLAPKIEQAMSMLRKGIEEGITQPACSVSLVPRQVDTLLNTPLDKLSLLKPFTKEHPQVPKEKLENFHAQAKNLVTSGIFPALRSLKTFLEEEYSQHPRPQDGIGCLKDGMEWYQKCLDFHLSCHMTPQEVHNLGLKEVARIRNQIMEVAKKEGLGDTMAEILDAINKREENYFKTKEEVLDYVRDLAYKKIRPQLTRVCKDLPDAKMKIDAAPDYMVGGATAFYFPGKADGSKEGCYFINTHDLKFCMPYHLTALTLHEGEPGHHVQNSLSIAATHWPDFRRFTGESHFYLVPRCFSVNTASLEGWGLYCEALGEELGLYKTNLELLGRYKFEIFRAARLVVDTGLHAFGWSRDEAIQYMKENTLTGTELVAEVERYITWPGQACAYKVGEMKIWELRRKAEQALGSQFDICEFHHRLLSCGQVPLRVLERVIDEYIAETTTECQAQD